MQEQNEIKKRIYSRTDLLWREKSGRERHTLETAHDAA